MTTPPNTDLSRLLEAVSFAADRHRHQRRKDVNATPYINHPLEVANILAQNGVDDVDVLIAAVLHDTVEDTCTSVQEITIMFGERVSEVVREVTDDKHLPKTDRKRLQILNAPGKSDGAKLIKIADKIANLRDLKSSPPNWSDARVAAYVRFAENVGQGCGGVNAQLDELFSEQLRNLA